MDCRKMTAKKQHPTVLTLDDILKFMRENGLSPREYANLFFDFRHDRCEPALSGEQPMRITTQIRLRMRQEGYLQQNAANIAATRYAKQKAASRAEKSRYLRSFQRRVTGDNRNMDMSAVVFTIPRDPCFKCGIRGDIGCVHYPLGSR